MNNTKAMADRKFLINVIKITEGTLFVKAIRDEAQVIIESEYDEIISAARKETEEGS